MDRPGDLIAPKPGLHACMPGMPEFAADSGTPSGNSPAKRRRSTPVTTLGSTTALSTVVSGDLMMETSLIRTGYVRYSG